MPGETSLHPDDWPSDEQARDFWKLVPKDRLAIFRFSFVCAEESSVNQLADYLRATGYDPVRVQEEAPYRWLVVGHTKAQVPSEEQLVSLHTWFHTISTQFRATFHSMQWRDGRAA